MVVARAVPLDGRSSVVRTRESALGNLIADLMRQAVSADIALLNSGTIRSDSVSPPPSTPTIVHVHVLSRSSLESRARGSPRLP